MSRLIQHIPSTIDFYEEGDLQGLDIQSVGQYLAETTEIPFRLRGSVYKGIPEERIETVADQLARIKVGNPAKRLDLKIPLRGEVDYEKRRIKESRWRIFGILYDGVSYQKIISDLIGERELDFNPCSILFTNQLFGTWDRDDRRFHARVSLYGFPHLISITGLVEAPAKPRDFHLKKQLGRPLELLKEEYRGRFLDHGDSRMTEVLKGYAMQALFFHLAGAPFCEDQDCRLFNSHWQEEVLHSQLSGQYEFCPRHEATLKELRDRKSEAASPQR